MPNIQKIQFLHKKYDRYSHNKQYLRGLDILKMSYNKSIYDIRSSFSFNGISPSILPYFEGQESADVILLFIDICNFSKTCEQLSNSVLSIFLDDYYDKVIPIIYKYGGEIEKIIGDGIICVFGQPFLEDNSNGLIDKADSCAKEIIMTLKNTTKEVKIALHEGEIMYYKNKTESYTEYTMIGKPITELFRLESVSENNSVNYYNSSLYQSKQCSESGIYKRSDGERFFWEKSEPMYVSLKGVEEKFMKHTKCSSKF